MPVANREFKDGLFKMLFGCEEHKEWALELYNALSGKNYDDPSLITFNMIDSFLYMGIRNDVSFVIDEILNMFEQQSTYNLNMPVRMLQYAGPVYEEYILSNKLNKLGSKLIHLPVPKLVVFYNGTKEEPDETILRLSDAFPEGSDPDIDVKVKMLNINYGKNKELFDKCKPLSEYAWFVHTVREEIEELKAEQNKMFAADEKKANQKSKAPQKKKKSKKNKKAQGEQKNQENEKSQEAQGEQKNMENKEGHNEDKEKDDTYMTFLAVAIDRAMSKMPEDFVIRSFLLTHLTEVKTMYFDEYNETMVRELFRNEGLEEGDERCNKLYAILLKEKRMKAIRRISRDKVYREKMYHRYGLVKP